MKTFEITVQLWLFCRKKSRSCRNIRCYCYVPVQQDMQAGPKK